MNLDLFSNFELVNYKRRKPIKFFFFFFYNRGIFCGLILVSRIDDVNSFRNGVKMLDFPFNRNRKSIFESRQLDGGHGGWNPLGSV